MPGASDEISILGFGCMRFKRNLAVIDMKKTERQIRMAIKAGVNYFDTAYVYMGSEKALGTILAKKDDDGVILREKVFIATKLPFMLLKNRADMDKYLQTSMERLGVDYIDYYLVHNLGGIGSWERGKKLGVLDFLTKAKAEGKIGNIGFSWHGSLHNFRKIIDDFDWQFCQIQYNYLDEYFQAGTEGLKYAASKGIGVIVMEPLRGGTLAAKLPREAMKIIDSYRDKNGEKHSPAYWALRWVWNHPEVICLLSGMTEDFQIEENLGSASGVYPGVLTDEDLAMIERVRDVFQKKLRVNCTGCAYCMPCPNGIDIPFCMSALNNQAMFGGISGKVMYNFSLRPVKGKPIAKASACQKCGACETKCTQNIEMIKTLEEAAKVLEGPFFRVISAIMSKVLGNDKTQKKQ
jgi:predicted aldo/keto reductase-like oxidoreductase